MSYETKRRGLVMIEKSRKDEFPDALAWAWWCRDVAAAALASDDDELERLDQEREA